MEISPELIAAQEALAAAKQALDAQESKDREEISELKQAQSSRKQPLMTRLYSATQFLINIQTKHSGAFREGDVLEVKWERTTASIVGIRREEDTVTETRQFIIHNLYFDYNNQPVYSGVLKDRNELGSIKYTISFDHFKGVWQAQRGKYGKFLKILSIKKVNP